LSWSPLANVPVPDVLHEMLVQFDPLAPEMATLAVLEHIFWSAPAETVGLLFTVRATLDVAFEQTASVAVAVKVSVALPAVASIVPGV